MHFPQENLPMARFIWLRVRDMKNNGTDITKAYHNGIEITSIMLNGVDVGAFTPPTPPTPDYQPWENYPDSPVLTEDYPYQAVIGSGSWRALIYSKAQFRIESGILQDGMSENGSNVYFRPLSGQAWGDEAAGGVPTSYPIYEANNDIYTDATLTSVYFAKTTE